MKNSSIAALAGLVFACAPALAQAYPTVAVLPFADTQAGENLGTAAAEEMATGIAAMGTLDLLERTRIHHALDELGFATSGMVDYSGGYVRIGELVAADFLISGAVTEASVETTEFSGYGVQTETQTWRLTLAVRAFETSTGRVRHGQTYDVERVIQNTNAHTTRDSGVYRDLMREAVQQAIHGLERSGIGSIQQPQLAPPVPVRIASQPAGASILVDGVVVATAPGSFEVTPGVHRIQVLLAGHQPWEQLVSCEAGTELNVTLYEQREADVVIEVR